MGKPDFRHIIEGNLALLERKSADYSRDNIQATGIEGIAARMMDKASRLLNLTSNGKAPNFESVADTLQDISNYGVIGQAVVSGEWSRSTNMVYLAGPIDNVDTALALGWRKSTGEILATCGVTSFNPCAAFFVGKQPPAELIRSINRHALFVSHICLVNLTGPTMGFGTLREIEYARSLGKRVIVAHNSKLDNHLDAYDLELVDTLEDAIYRIVGK